MRYIKLYESLDYEEISFEDMLILRLDRYDFIQKEKDLFIKIINPNGISKTSDISSKIEIYKNEYTFIFYKLPDDWFLLSFYKGNIGFYYKCDQIVGLKKRLLSLIKKYGIKI
jgi:hypothetical protein